jgi:hypothetical protein
MTIDPSNKELPKAELKRNQLVRLCGLSHARIGKKKSLQAEAALT